MKKARRIFDFPCFWETFFWFCGKLGFYQKKFTTSKVRALFFMWEV